MKISGNLRRRRMPYFAPLPSYPLVADSCRVVRKRRSPRLNRPLTRETRRGVGPGRCGQLDVQTRRVCDHPANPRLVAPRRLGHYARKQGDPIRAERILLCLSPQADQGRVGQRPYAIGLRGAAGQDAEVFELFSGVHPWADVCQLRDERRGRQAAGTTGQRRNTSSR